MIESILAALCVVIRMLRPSRGSHAAPRGPLAERSGHVHRGTPANVAERARERFADAPRAARGRRYAELLPATGSVDPYGSPLPVTPLVRVENVNPQAALVRGYYVAFEREQERAERSRTALQKGAAQ